MKTAPHVVEPKNLGAVDEILHLGEYWNEGLLRQHKNEIMATNFAMVNGAIHQIAKSIISKADTQFKNEPKERHLFATALTPGGNVHHLDSILQDVQTLHLITGEASAIGSYIVGTIADAINSMRRSLSNFD
ncbi:hypothetical protein V6C27_14330 [Peptococcaceae bacterium 1198_IL3148]